MDQRHLRDSLAAATRAEQDAYRLMRSLIPDLDLPAVDRSPLSRRQEVAAADYDHARQRLRVARALANEDALRHSHPVGV